MTKHIQHRCLSRNGGFTLIEAMVSTVLGLIVLTGVTLVAAKVLQANTAALKSARLNQDLGAAMQTMADDIRRAGYDGNPDPVNNTIQCPTNDAQCTYKTEGEELNIVSRNCILYSYDRNDNDVIEAGERLGFKLENNQLRARLSCNPSAGGGTNCVSDCTTGSWEYLSDDNTQNVLSITDLNLSTIGSKCQEITHHSNVTAGKENNYWIVVDNTPTVHTDDPTGFPCLATSGTNLNTFVLNAAIPPVYVTGTFVAPSAGASPPNTGDRTVETRQVNISLAGKIKRPAQFDATASSKKLESSIKIRNDRIRKH